MTKENVTLYYREGSSDKIYQAAIEEAGGGFVVNFAYGRRGSTLNTGTKTQSPVPFEEAKSIYDKLVKSKTSKGYTPGEDGTPYQHTDKEVRATGVLPQLCNPIDNEEVRACLSNRGFWMQEKFDGKRVLIKQDDETGTIGINRKGLTIGLPSPVCVSARSLPASFILDGECIGDTYHAFDLLALNGDDLRSWSYKERHTALLNLLGSAQRFHIEIVPTAVVETEKSRMLLKLRGSNKEGVVFKRPDAPYTAGRPASGGAWLKYKFTVTGSFIVNSINSVRSVGLEVCAGTDRIPVGNVTIPANKKVPTLGKIIEVRYLYAYRGGSLYQPVFLHERSDLEEKDCVIGQLKYKADGDEEEG